MAVLVRVWQKMLGPKVNVIWAPTIEAARIELTRSLDFDAVLMDCCVPGNIPNTYGLTREIRSMGFTKPIIAKSSTQDYCLKQLEFGATHAAVNGDVIEVLFEVLKLDQNR